MGIFSIVDFEHHTENRGNWINIDTIRIPCPIIYPFNSVYYKNPTEFYRNRTVPRLSASENGYEMGNLGERAQLSLLRVLYAPYNKRVRRTRSSE